MQTTKLTEYLIEPFLVEQVKAKKVVGVYSGRFQPFGPHHKKTYEWLKKKFGNAYIVTSDIKGGSRHPMNFKEKKRHMVKMGIPANRIIKVKNPYVAKELTQTLGKDTAVVFAFGKKDAGRLASGKYFQDYKKNKNNMVGYEEHGYVVTAPHISIRVAGNEVSGTTMRQILGKEGIEDKDRKVLFKKLFGYFDKGLYNMLTNKFKKLSKEQIEEFLTTIDLTQIIKESATTTQSPTDDGPPTFYRGFSDYRKQSEKWIDSMYKELGWEVLDFILAKGAVNPDFDYTLKYTIVPAVAYGRKQSGEYGTRFGVDNPIEKYKEHLNRVVDQIGWEVVKWMGITPDGKSYTGVEVEAPILPGVGDDNVENTERAERKAEKDEEGNLKLNTVKEIFNLDEELKVLLGEDIKPDIIKSFIIRDSLNTKVWDGDKLKPEIRKKLLLIAKNFFKDLELEPNVKLQDITLTGSISNYNWSKFSDIDLHLRIDFSTVDDDEDFVQNYVLAKKTIWNNKHDIKMYGFPVEVYVENIGEAHVASGLYSILNDKWLVVPKKKELQIDLDDIRSKAEGYLGSKPVLQKMMKDGKYDEIIQMVEKIQDKLKRMRSSGLERGGEFSVENLAFKALRRSPFIGDIIQMKNDAYDKKMSMKEKLDLTEYVNLLVTNKPYNGKELLLMGGAYGHMNHPFDDKDLTFGDIKKIIDLGLSGNLSKEEAVSEKTDGQNLMVTWRDGKLLAARNKSQLRNKGKGAMDALSVARKFSGRGDIKNAFVFAMKDLQKAVGKLNDKQRNKIFGEGSNFMNLEIIYPATSNIIDYDQTVLQFHGAIRYDDSGKPKGIVPGSGRILQGMIKQVNQDIQKKFRIIKPQIVSVPKQQDFGKRREYYFKKLDKLKKQYGLKDTDTLGMYHQSYWMEFINNASKQYTYAVPNKVLMNLTKRWAFGDKSYTIQQIRNDIDNERFLEWVLSTDKMDVEKKQKENMKPFEVLIFEVGAEILKNIGGFLSASPERAVQKIRTDVIKSIKDVRKGGDLKKLNKLKQQISKLNSIGGFKAIVPAEGIVFKYRGKTYKFTGAFAPINQITGLMTF